MGVELLLGSLNGKLRERDNPKPAPLEIARDAAPRHTVVLPVLPSSNSAILFAAGPTLCETQKRKGQATLEGALSACKGDPLAVAESFNKAVPT